MRQAHLFDPTPLPSERQWMHTIQRRLSQEGWVHQHVYRLQTKDGMWRTSTTARGWPDLVCFRGEYIVAIECKGPKGRPEPGQLAWLERFAAIPTGRAWLLAPNKTDWQALANWIHDPATAPRTFGFESQPALTPAR